MWIYINSLKRYNEGELFGETINLPVKEDTLKDIVNKYSFNGNHDIAIHDYTLPFEISEFENVFKINKVCDFIKDNKLQPLLIKHIEDTYGESILELEFNEFLKYKNEVHTIIAKDKKEFCLGYYEYIEYNFKNIPDEIRNSINWDHLFDQLEIELTITQDKENNRYYFSFN